MTIKLYKNNAEEHRLDKTQYLVEVATLVGTLRSSSSIIFPIITVEYTDIKFNYAYIAEFNRYYFVDDNIILVGNNLMELHLTVDPIMSYKNSIRGLTALVVRNSNLYDNKIKDDYVICDNNSIIETTKLYSIFNNQYDSGPNDNSGDKYMSVILNYNTNYVILSCPDVNWIEGSGSPLHPRNIYPLATNWNVMTLLKDTELQTLAEGLNHISDACMSFINGLYKLPFKVRVPHDSLTSGHINFNCYLNDHNVWIPRQGYSLPAPEHSVNICKALFSGFSISETFTIHKFYNDFRDYDPYTKYEFYCPYVGWITLSPELFLEKPLKWSMRIDSASMKCIIALDTEDCTLYAKEVDCLQKISLNQINEVASEDRRMSNTLSLLTGTVTNAATIAASAFVPSLAVSGAIGVASTTANFALNTITNRVTADNGISLGTASTFDNIECMYRITRQSIDATRYNNLNELYGKPLYQIKNLTTLTGYTLLDKKTHFENFSNATKKEIDMIINILTVQGIIL